MVGLAVLVMAAAGCGGVGSDPGGEIRVSAAASLTDAFASIEQAYEDAHPGTDVVLNLAASSSLREQILEGAPVDVFASANLLNMQVVADAGMVVGEPAVFAGNTLQIAVPPGNPGGVSGLADLSREELLVGLCAAGVPCGDFAREALALAGVEAAVDTDEPNVRALLTKVIEGELDAGIVYTTDVAAAGSVVEGIAVPAGHNVAAEYPIAVLAGAPDPVGAEAFVAFVLGAEGRAILAGHGFTLP